MPERPLLATPYVLLKRSRRKDLRLERAGPVLAITPEQKRAFTQLFELRNRFLHFEPLGWSINTTGMAVMFEKVLTIVGQTIDDGWSFRHLSDSDRERLAQLYHNLVVSLANLE